MSLLNPVGALRESATIYQPVFGMEMTNLKAAVIDARGDINEIRMLFKGNAGFAKKLFKKAVHEGDVITQIQLSQTLFGMKWGKDDTKDFSSLAARDLETFFYYPGEFALFNLAYDQAMEVESDWKTHDTRGVETFRLAASRGYLPAFLELMSKEWNGHTDSYGFAVQLRPFVGKGDRQLDYHFGRALKNGCQIGSALYYEGLYWMNQSCGIHVKYPSEHQPFEGFKNYYVRYEDVGSTYYDYDGFRYVDYDRFRHLDYDAFRNADCDGFRNMGGLVVIAPSEEAWMTFVQEKLEHVKIAPIEAYLFTFDPEQLKSLLDKYKIGADHTNSFVESSSDEVEIKDLFEKKIHGFRIDSLSIYQGDEQIGKISVQKDTFKIHQTFENTNIKPIIDFIENVMTRTGSAHSAHSWLKQMGGLIHKRN